MNALDVKWRHILFPSLVLLFFLFHLYTALAIHHDFERAMFLIIILILSHLIWIYFCLKKTFPKREEQLQKAFGNAWKAWNDCKMTKHSYFHGTWTSLLFVGFIGWILFDSSGDLNRLRPLIAILFYLIFCMIFSANPSRIKWRPVIGGFILQISFGLLVLRWSSGQRGLHFISNKIVGFLDFTTAGTIFNFNFIASPPNICGMGYVFFFTSLQIVIYFAVVVSILNYFRVIEFVLSRIAVVMQYTMGTTAAESLNAAACIFVGQTEAAILIGPSLGTMTESEIHSVMTAGFACIAGSLFSAYISFGAQPAYLLSATVMNATVSLGISKMVYPEVQKSRQKKANSFKFDTHKGKSLPQLMYEAARHASRLVINIGANLIVYIALLAFLNDAVSYLGDCVGLTDLSFNKLLGYLFFPFAYLMGVSDAENHQTQIEESFRVAELMGMKTFLNEFIAYQKLKEMVVAGSLKGARAQMIATYALCGFSNISMIGSQLGILGSLCPWRKGIFAKVVVRALFSGCISCFITASIAGILVAKPLKWSPMMESRCFNTDELLTNHSKNLIFL